jgi:hypothetical protein
MYDSLLLNVGKAAAWYGLAPTSPTSVTAKGELSLDVWCINAHFASSCTSWPIVLRPRSKVEVIAYTVFKSEENIVNTINTKSCLAATVGAGNITKAVDDLEVQFVLFHHLGSLGHSTNRVDLNMATGTGLSLALMAFIKESADDFCCAFAPKATANRANTAMCFFIVVR